MKAKLLFRGPVLTASGYGVHSRQVLRALLASDVFDISVIPCAWGQTPFLFEDEPYLRIIRQLAAKREVEEREGRNKYDLSVQVTIPNEFQKMAPLNIGVTAGIEVDRVSPEWISKCNEMVDLVVVPSKHSAETLARVQYQSADGQTLRLKKPVMVAPEGVDTRVYNTEPSDPKLTEQFDFETDFNFLCVGLGMDKGLGEDRKNISSLIKWFSERFKDDQNVGLVLKMGLVNNSLMDFETCRRKIGEFKAMAGAGQFPRIYLLHGRLSDAEMAALYKHPKIKAMVSLTHGEGYGLPMIEAAACGLPVMATNWSGHLDFLQIEGKNRFIPVDYELKEIPGSAVWKGVMEQGTRWAYPKEEDAKNKLKKVVLSYEKPKEWATELAQYVGEQFNLERVCFDLAKGILEFVNQHRQNNPVSEAEFAENLKKQLGEGKKVIYTMPMSAGDVYISTAVVNSIKKKYPDHKLFFATTEPYATILKENKDVDQVIRYEPWMQNVPLMERVFDEVFTPNLAIQTIHSNWVRGGKGRRLADEMAAQCNVDLGEYFIKLDDVDGLPEKFIAFQPGSGKGQWEARNYLHWQEVVNNISKLTGLPIVQLGIPDDPLYQGCVDLRGKTTYNQLANVVSKAACLVSIDTVSMHMAAGLGTPHVALFGSSYANSTGPAKSKSLSVLLETPDRYSCDKACYKYQCSVDKDHPCINEITPKLVVENVLRCLANTSETSVIMEKMSEYEEFRPKISGYTHLLNPEEQGFPYLECVQSMLGFCDEVVVVDGGSTDGSLDKLRALGDDRLKIYDHQWDWSEPGMDGMQKAYGRAMCTGDFLWQQDADEVVHEDDYQKIRDLVKRFPSGADLIDLPVVELWGGSKLFRTDRHPWKWRLSRNDFRITHGINKNARVIDEKTGKTYAKKGMSDGCEYIDIMTGDFIPHRSFYSRELEMLRLSDPAQYAARMNEIFEKLPCIFHYSWANIPRKIRSFRDFWDKCWSNLYNEEKREQRFFPGRDLSTVTDDEIMVTAIEVQSRGGEHGQSSPQPLRRSNPTCMDKWLGRIVDEYRTDRGHLRDDQGSAGPAGPVSQISGRDDRSKDVPAHSHR